MRFLSIFLQLSIPQREKGERALTPRAPTSLSSSLSLFLLLPLRSSPSSPTSPSSRRPRTCLWPAQGSPPTARPRSTSRSSKSNDFFLFGFLSRGRRWSREKGGGRSSLSLSLCLRLLVALPAPSGLAEIAAVTVMVFIVIVAAAAAAVRAPRSRCPSWREEEAQREEETSSLGFTRRGSEDDSISFFVLFCFCCC